MSARDDATPGALMLAGCSLLLAGIAVLLDAVGGYHAGFATLNALGASVPPVLLQCLTYCGDSLCACVAVAVLARRYPQMLWTLLLSGLVALLLSHALKELVDSARPPAVLQQLFVEGPRYRRGSFPSGHSVTAFFVAGSVAVHLRSPALRVLLLLVAGCIAASRVMVGVHWPLDTAVGAALGCVSVLLGTRLAARWRWGLSVPGHLLLVALFGAAALALLCVPIPYPRAETMARSIATLTLLVTASNYLRAPVLAALKRMQIATDRA